MDNVSDEVKRRTDIVSLIGQYVNLERRGGAIKGLCPFHQEKTPSFTIQHAKQHFHCFGCGASGDVYEFLMKHEGIDFKTALARLASSAGIDIESGQEKLGRILEAHDIALDLYRANLTRNSSVLSHLKEERGLTDESIEKFRVGVTSGTLVSAVLKKKGFTDEEIVDAGLAWKSEEKKQLYDTFWKRIMFPIPFQGAVRGFGGRIIGEGDPKYKNSPSTPAFQKSEILYGLDVEAIKEMGFVIIEEGNFDVILSHQHRFRNAVAPLGTALTVAHIQLLKKYTDTFILLFDGDDAGKAAAIKSARMLLDEHCRGGVGILPSGEDPASFLKNSGDLKAIIDDATPLPVFVANEVPEEKRKVLDIIQYLSTHQATAVHFVGGDPAGERFVQQMAAFAHVAALFPRDSMVVRKKGIEVRKNLNCLALFEAGQFKFMAGVSKNLNHKVQASRIMERYLQKQALQRAEKSEDKK